jgi:thioredoxin-like negative regulator of GroEL
MNTPFLLVDDVTFAQTIASGLALVEIGAPWCGACKSLAATLLQMAPSLEPKVKLVQMNAEDCPGITGRFGVKALPTMLLFRDGRLVNRRVGASSRSAIEDFLVSA